MKRSANFLALCACVASSGFAATATAQDDPDLRDLLPFMMLVVDTSGSMERLPGCQCDDLACSKCLPDCSLPNDVGGVPPKNADGTEAKKNRWAMALEALTGAIDNFECEPLARTAANGMTYDLGYYLPYHQPWDCLGESPGTGCSRYDALSTCSVSSDCTDANYPICDPVLKKCSAMDQQNNGILDSYASRIRFGLMTFDPWDTYVGAGPLVPANEFDKDLSESVLGLWSYAGAKTFHYPNCFTNYKMDTGARSKIATEGELISMNSCDDASNCPSWCPSCPPPANDLLLGPTNGAIQEALLKARPYGGTPIAGSLDDLYYHFQSDVNDPFGSCRFRYALLITDGYPDADYRDFGCNCKNEGDQSDVTRCGASLPCDDPISCPNHPDNMMCPYQTPEEIAFDLVHGRGSDGPMIEALYVVGLDVDPTISERLNAIAFNGGSEQALFASDVPSLLSSLESVLGPASKPISRAVPVFVGGAGPDGSGQYQVSTGFQVPAGLNQPWTGILERRRLECVGSVLKEDIQINDNERFQWVLNNSAPAVTERKLWSVVSQSGKAATPPTWPNGHLWDGPGQACDSSGTGCPGTLLRTGESSIAFPGGVDITPQDFKLNPPDEAQKTALMDWMYGDNGSPRETNRLGDIYHSTPVVAGTPRFDTADEAFNLFRDSALVQKRPLVLYVGSNDGIMHAFSVEDYTAPTSTEVPNSRDLVTGEELWGFVPPLFLERLKDGITAHRYTMDGTPVVKNVYFNKTLGADGVASSYRTVLVSGFRNGGPGYFALDVTNPFAPKFLWQFAHPALGDSYGQPAVVQAVFKKPGLALPGIKQGAIAILPGGVGKLGNSGITGDCTNDPLTQSKIKSGGSYYTWHEDEVAGTVETKYHRSGVPCWRDIGRALYFIDVEDGQVIKEIHQTVPGTNLVPYFPSPMVSTPAVYESEVGTLASRAFMVDANGVIWRIDMSKQDPVPNDPDKGWTARPFHDIFYDRAPDPMTPDDYGEPTYEAPILSIDEEGRLVVIVGTGDNDNFTKAYVENRVVSLYERIEVDGNGVPLDPSDPDSHIASMNWEMRVETDDQGFVPSELVTGTMGLFNGQLFFGSFIPISGGNACDVGRGRLHAVDFVARGEQNTDSPYGGTAAVTTFGPKLLTVTDDADALTAINVPASAAIEDFMVFGLGVTQRPTCSVLDNEIDVFGDPDNMIKPITALSDPAIFLVAHASGSADLIKSKVGEAIRSIELKIDKPVTVSRIRSWSGSVD